MRKTVFLPVLVIGLVIISTITGCGKKEESKPAVDTTAVTTPPPPEPPKPSVASVTLAKGMGQDKSPVDVASEFKPKETVYAIVRTDNAVAGSVIGARWYYTKTNQEVGADSISLKDNGTNMTDLKLMNKKGMPAGEYKVDISLNGEIVKSEMFKVVK